MGSNNDSVAYWGCGSITAILIGGVVIGYLTATEGMLWWTIAAAISVFCFIILIVSSVEKKHKKQPVNYDSLISELEHSMSSIDQNSVKNHILCAYRDYLVLLKQYQELKSLYDKLLEKKKKKNEAQIIELEKTMKDLSLKLDYSGYDACEGLEEIALHDYEQVCQSFALLADSKAILYQTKDDKMLPIEITTGVFDHIMCPFNVPKFTIPNTNLTIYIYPCFIIQAISYSIFDVIPLKDVSIDAKRHFVGWMKKDEMPSDCHDYIQQYTHQKKDGSPDMRYSYNPIQVFPKYGQIMLSVIDGSILVSNQALWYSFVIDMANLINQHNPNKIKVSNIKDDDLERITRNLETLVGKTHKIEKDVREITEKRVGKLEDLIVADEIFSFCQHLEKDAGFWEEHNRHNIKVTGSNGKPLCGEGGEVRSLFFLDIAHCYSEMADIIDLKRDDGIGILYLMFRLIEPVTPIPHDRQHIDVIKSTLPSGAESLINQIKGKPFFSDGDIDFTVAAILKRYNKDLLNKYLTLLFRYCSLIAKADGNITDKEQHFLDHIAKLRSNSMNSHEGVTVRIAPALPEKHDGIAELDGLIGLDSVKQEVRTMSNFIKVQLTRQQQGLKATQVSYHCVFTGNPGTGKTTVARILAGIYNELGVLKKGHLVETDRSGLVAEYVGQTAVKTNKVIDSALDGVLFIDEAYSLVTGSGNDFGNEAIATLLKRMEDDRERLIVILAGYGDEMKLFIDSNPGLQSRFNRYIHFPDYNADELLQIYSRYVQKNDYEVSPDAINKLKMLLEEAVVNKDKNFGNGRFVRNLFEKTLENQANRLSTIERPSLGQLKEIKSEDIS